MTKMIRTQLVLAAAVALASAVCFAGTSGDATYAAKCKMCHGPAGTPANAAMAKSMGIKPTSDPAIKALSVAQIKEAVLKGKGKMHPIAGLSDAQAQDVSEFFHSLK